MMQYEKVMPRARVGFIIPTSNRMVEPQVQRFMPAVEPRAQGPEAVRDPGRLVDRNLLLEREVQAHVQEGVGLVGVVAVAMARERFEDRVVLRVLQDDLERERLDSGERCSGPVLAPGAEEHLAHFIARRVEHPSSSAGIRTGPGSGTPGSRACARGTHSARAGSASGAHS